MSEEVCRVILQISWLLSLTFHLRFVWSNTRCRCQAREGLGGGFNERQDRASVATVEVDEDGYDDFGRKKNKARADKKAKEVRWRILSDEHGIVRVRNTRRHGKPETR